MYALSDENRQHLIRLALMIVCGGTAILPFTVPPTSPAAQAQTSTHVLKMTVPDIPGKLEFPPITVERDPFVTDSAAPANLDAKNAALVNSLERGDEIGTVLPPNEGALEAQPASSTSVPIVRGVVLGDLPQALLEVGGGIKVVSIGDRVGSEVVRSIDAAGVVLSSGLRLRIARASVPR